MLTTRLRRRRPDAPEGDERPRRSGEFARRIVLGVVAGTIATLVMTAFRIPISGSLPPTANFWAKYVGGDPDDHTVVGLVMHLVYGAGAGVPFAVAFPADVGPDVRGERRGVLWGVVYGLLLSSFGVRVVLERLLDMDLAADERFVFHVGHVVYGLTLGTWLGSRLSE